MRRVLPCPVLPGPRRLPGRRAAGPRAASRVDQAAHGIRSGLAAGGRRGGDDRDQPGGRGRDQCPARETCPVDPVKLSLTGVQLGQAIVVILAVLVVGNEYSTGLIRVTLAAMPKRMQVLGAKAAIVTALGAGPSPWSRSPGRCWAGTPTCPVTGSPPPGGSLCRR